MSVAYAFQAAPVAIANPDGQKLSAGFLSLIKESSANGILLVEGRREYTGALVLEVVDGDNVVISHGFPVEITGVEQMFAHRDLRAVAGGIAEIGDRFVGTDIANAGKLKAPYCMGDPAKKLVWMHGYHVDPEAARATYAEVFKRFFHTGFNGRFYGVSWFGDPPTFSLLPPHYHQTVVNAFATAGPYAEFVTTLQGHVSVVGHSMGNMVVSLAIEDHGLGFSKYFAIDAAVAMEAYGDKQEVDSMIQVEDWLDYWTYETIDPDGNVINPARRLLASEWHELFKNTSDSRKSLTWRDRLRNVANSENVYNFYSSTEDVLRTYTGDNLFFDGAGASLGMYSWVKQEKFKGRRSKVNADVGGATSNYCGWSFNENWFVDVGNDYKVKRSPEDAIFINDLELQTKPFFSPHVVTASGISEPSLNNLVTEVGGLTPSDFVNELVADTYLSHHYNGNEAAHGRVIVKDWLLAEAFPATTLPAGANRNNSLPSDDQNINMSTEQPDGCKTSEAKWPRDATLAGEGKDWRHSDYKDVPYQHVFEFYNKIRVLVDNQ